MNRFNMTFGQAMFVWFTTFGGLAVLLRVLG